MPIPVIFRYPNSLSLFVPQPNWKPGGAPIQMYTLATELAKDSDFSVYFWFDGPVPKHPIQGVTLISNSYPVHRWLGIISKKINQYRSKKIERISSGGVVIFSVWANPTYIEYQPRIQAAGGKTLYRIASEVDVDESRRPGEGSHEFTQALLNANGVVAQTAFQKTELKRLLGKDSEVIPSSFRGEYSDTAERDIVLWVGQACNYKRPHLVLKLAELLPNEIFLMIMPENDPAVASEIKIAAEVLDNVQIIPYVAFDQIQQYYNRAKVVLNTSEFEGYPNTLHQACIACAPYVSMTWNPDSFFEKNGIGLCANSDIDLMFHHVQWLCDNPDQATEIGMKGRAYFESHHQVETVIEMYKHYIRQLVAE